MDRSFFNRFTSRLDQSILSQLRAQSIQQTPEAGLEWIHLGVTGNKASGELIIKETIDRHQLLPLWIPSDIFGNVLKRGCLSLVISQDMIIGLILQATVR